MADSSHNNAVPDTPSGDPIHVNSNPDSNDIPSSLSGEPPVNPLSNKQSYTGFVSSIVNDHGIINLSSYTLSDSEKRLLTKGLSFCPSPGECNLSRAREAFDKLHCSLRLTHYFDENGAPSDPSEDEGFSHRNFRPRSNWTPADFPPPTLASFITTNNTALTGTLLSNQQIRVLG